MKHVLFEGCAAEECFKTLMARRDNKVVVEGKSLLLWCDVQHCGTKSWTGGWGIVKEDTFTLLRASSRLHIYNEDLLSNSTRLNVNFITTNKSDSGTYQCRINWGQTSNNGHVTYVNVTDGRSYYFVELGDLYLIQIRITTVVVSVRNRKCCTDNVLNVNENIFSLHWVAICVMNCACVCFDLAWKIVFLSIMYS